MQQKRGVERVVNLGALYWRVCKSSICVLSASSRRERMISKLAISVFVGQCALSGELMGFNYTPISVSVSENSELPGFHPMAQSLDETG